MWITGGEVEEQMFTPTAIYSSVVIR